MAISLDKEAVAPRTPELSRHALRGAETGRILSITLKEFPSVNLPLKVDAE